MVIKEILYTSAAGLLVVCALFFFNFYLSGNFLDIQYLSSGNNAQKLSFENLNFPNVARIWHMVIDTSKWLFPIGIFESGNLKIQGKSDVVLSIVALLASVGRITFEIFRNKEKREVALLFLGLIVSVTFGHILYSFNGGRFGERFFFEITVLFVIYAVRAIFAAAEVFSEGWIRRAFVIVLFSGSTIPYVLWLLPNTARYFRKSNESRMDIFIQTERKNITNSLIFIEDTPEFEATFYTRNNPDLSGNIFVLGLSDNRTELQKRLPGRKSFIYRLKKNWDGFELVEVGKL